MTACVFHVRDGARTVSLSREGIDGIGGVEGLARLVSAFTSGEDAGIGVRVLGSIGLDDVECGGRTAVAFGGTTSVQDGRQGGSDFVGGRLGGNTEGIREPVGVVGTECAGTGVKVSVSEPLGTGELGELDDVGLEKLNESLGFDRGKWFASNRRKREKRKAMKCSWRGPRVGSDGGCLSSGSEVGSVRTVDTRTGVEIEAAQTLAARRVAENRVAVKLAELKLKRLGDEGRTAVVERLAAATFEKRINEARSKAQKSFDGSEDSLKSLGSMGSAGELYARQAIKKSRDDAKTLRYVQSQAELLLRYVTPEVRQMVTDMPRPEYEDEFDVFGDCPGSFDEGDREAYYDRLAARNAELSLLSQ